MYEGLPLQRGRLHEHIMAFCPAQRKKRFIATVATAGGARGSSFWTYTSAAAKYKSVGLTSFVTNFGSNTFTL